ncbi:MAG: hypothetical protein PHP45_05450 [Elusimicrobiales bacterium]|nr:hypothetical protein [Elusimicrobiales bacterium]
MRKLIIITGMFFIACAAGAQNDEKAAKSGAKPGKMHLTLSYMALRGETPANTRVYAEGFITGEILPNPCNRLSEPTSKAILDCASERDEARALIKKLKMQLVSYDDSEVKLGVKEALLTVKRFNRPDDDPKQRNTELFELLKSLPGIEKVQPQDSGNHSDFIWRLESATPMTLERWRRTLEPLAPVIGDLRIPIGLKLEVSAETDKPAEAAKELQRIFSQIIMDAQAG